MGGGSSVCCGSGRGGREKVVSDGSMKTDTFFTAASSPCRLFDTEKMLSKYLPSK